MARRSWSEVVVLALAAILLLSWPVAAGAAIWVQPVEPSGERSSWEPVSLVALSVHVREMEVVVVPATARFVGALGAGMGAGAQRATR